MRERPSVDLRTVRPARLARVRPFLFGLAVLALPLLFSPAPGRAEAPPPVSDTGSQSETSSHSETISQSADTESSSAETAPAEKHKSLIDILSEKRQLPVKKAAGPKIREIKIVVRDVFDEPDIGWLYQTANSLKINTREEVVRRELLFSEGEVYDQFLVDESVRNLRTLPFLREVEITPTYTGGEVDIIVSVQDTWTLYPIVGFSSGSGSDRQTFGLNEGNVAGFGKRLGLLYGTVDNNDTLQAYYDDRRLFGTKQRLTSGYLDRSDGYAFLNQIGRPFRSLVDPYSWRLNTNVSDLVDKTYKDGSADFLYREEALDIDGGVSLSKGDPETLLWRYTAGWGYTKHLFSLADAQDFNDVNEDPAAIDEDPAKLAKDRRFSGPQLSFERIETDFISASYIDKFERVEDYNLGNVFGTFVQWSPEVLVSDDSYLLFGLSDADGTRLSDSSFLRGAASVRGRTQMERFENVIAAVDMRYYNTLDSVSLLGLDLGNHTIASSLSLDQGESLDKDRQFLLGADTGLRGYHARLFEGDQALLFNLEDRFFVAEDVLHLFNFGGALFFDAGGTSNNGIGDILSDELRTDVGIGLRIGLPRSSGSTVVRIDLAFPLRHAPDDTEPFSPRLMITAGQAFPSNLPGEAAAKEDQNPFSVGFNP